MTTTTEVLILTEFAFLVVICFVLIRHYKSSLVTTDVALSVYLCWVLGFAGILLLPYDISMAIMTNHNNHNPSLKAAWGFIYWSTFMLTWAVLPLQLGYHQSGQFTFIAKLKDAVYKNIYYGIVVVVSGVIFIIYFASVHHVSISQVIAFLMAFGNTYGVLLIIVLMGNGLIDLPRRLWEISDYEAELMRLYVSAPDIEQSYQEAIFELQECEQEVKKAEQIIDIASKGAFDKRLLNYISILNNLVSNFELSNKPMIKLAPVPRNGGDDTQYSTAKSFIDLHARLIKAQTHASACECRWKNLLVQCQQYEHLTKSKDSPQTSWYEMPTDTFIKSPRSRIRFKSPVTSSCCTKLYNYAYNAWTHRYHPIFCRVVSILCLFLSVIVLLSELVLATGFTSPIGIFITRVKYDQPGSTSAFIQCVTFVCLCYMSICTYWSLFRNNFGSEYELHGPNETTSSALIFNGEYLSRLQFTLGYNFLLILSINRSDFTSFSRLMSNMRLIPVFGSSFLIYVPLITIIVSLITLFNGYSRIASFFGVETEEADGYFFRKFVLSDDNKETYNVGKALVISELKRFSYDDSRPSIVTSNRYPDVEMTKSTTSVYSLREPLTDNNKRGGGVPYSTLRNNSTHDSTAEEDSSSSSHDNSNKWKLFSGVPSMNMKASFQRLSQKSDHDMDSSPKRPSSGVNGGTTANNPMISAALAASSNVLTSRLSNSNLNSTPVRHFRIDDDEGEDSSYSGRYSNV